MIARSWSCRTDSELADALLTQLERTGIAEARATPGYRGHLLTRRATANSEVVFDLITFWTDMEAITGFAGDDLEAARLYPGDEEFVLSVDDRVVHSFVVDGCLP